jgi:hypothetical protein
LAKNTIDVVGIEKKIQFAVNIIFNLFKNYSGENVVIFGTEAK